MLRYIVRRLLMMIPVLIGATLIVFAIISMAATFWPEWKNSKPWERAKKKLPKN